MARWRIAAHLQRQDWAAVAIDLAIVVLGVFLGIQAANCNDARKDHAASRAYLQRIRDDLLSDVRKLDARAQFWRDETAAGKRALQFAEHPVGGDWALLNDFYAAGQTWQYSSTDATYYELVGAGRLDLIRDVSLRKQLSDYYVGQRDQIDFISTGRPDYRKDIRSVVPFRIQEYLITKCQIGWRVLVSDQCPPPQDAGDVRGLLHRIANDDKLIGELRSWMTDLHYMRSLAHNRRGQAASLAERIDRQLR